MRNVFIDTSSMREKSFDFEGKTLKALVELCKSHEVRLVMTSVTRRECVKHIQSICDEIEEKSSRANVVLRNTGKEEIDFGQLKADMLARWERFLRDVEVVEIPIVEADLEKVFDTYFENKPPFEGKNKKCEFPDAIVGSALDEWCEKNGEKLFVVSGDRGFRDASIRHLTPLNSVEELVSSVNKEIESEKYKRAERAFNSVRGELEELVKDAMEERYYYIPKEWFSEVADFVVERVEIFEPFYIELTNHSCVIDFDVDIDFSASISFAEDDMVYRDSDTRDFVAVEKHSSSVSKGFTTTFSAELEYENEPEEATVKQLLKSSDVEIEIDLDDLPHYPVEIIGTSR